MVVRGGASFEHASTAVREIDKRERAASNNSSEHWQGKSKNKIKRGERHPLTPTGPSTRSSRVGMGCHCIVPMKLRKRACRTTLFRVGIDRHIIPGDVKSRAP